MKKKSVDDVAAENATGLNNLAQLQPGADFGPPGAGTGSNRLHGKFAACDWGGVTSPILCSDWEVTFEQEFADGTAHGEYWDFPVPTKMSWTGRATAHVRSGGANGATAGDAAWAGWMAQHILFFKAGRLTADPATALFSGFGDSPPGLPIFQAPAFVSRASFSAPRNGAATQEITLRGVGVPTYGFLAT